MSHPFSLLWMALDLPIDEAKCSFATWRIVVAESQDGGTRLRCNRDRLETFAAMLLSLGKWIVVNHPPELYDTFAQLAAQALQAADKRMWLREGKLDQELRRTTGASALSSP
jgi:hypothetical protein